MDKPTAIRNMRRIMHCAKLAGIDKHTFLSFGTLLGLVRENSLIEWDDDTDFSIFADKITPEQELKFFDLLNTKIEYPGEKRKIRLFEYRRSVQRRPDTGRLVHVSLRSELKGETSKWATKSCIWFWFPWNGYYWHTKAGIWSNKIGCKLKPPISKETANGIAKGIRIPYIEKLRKVKFYGQEHNIPVNYGSCLDVWYPQFMTPKQGGASDEDVLLIIKKWDDESTWTMKQR